MALLLGDVNSSWQRYSGLCLPHGKGEGRDMGLCIGGCMPEQVTYLGGQTQRSQW